MKEMILEDKLRIEKEAEGISRLRIWPEHVRVTFKTGYINGATAEHERMAELLKEERNKSIQECITTLLNDQDIMFNGSDILGKLESFKR